MSKQPSNKSNNSPLAPLAVGFFIGAMTIGTVVLVWNHDREPHSYPVYRASEGTPAPATPAAVGPTLFPSFGSTTTPVADPAVRRVAARFACACGTCGEKRLDICSCETAQAERAFIQEQLRRGHSEGEAVEAVKAKYGGLKS